MRAPLALIVLGATAGPVTAAALPPPPYAADPQFQAAPQYGGPYSAPYASQSAYRQQPQASDRYSGGAAHPVAAPAPQYYGFGQQPASAAAPGRTLGWSGKVEAAQQAAAQTPQGGWGQMSSRWSAPAPQPAAPQPQRIAYPTVRTPAFQPPATSQGWRPLYPSASPAAAQPRTIYDPPRASAQAYGQQQAVPQQPAAPQRQASFQNSTGPHFYSLHREYGIEPDPIPIPPRFFGPTADLSAPPPDPVLKRVTDASGQTHTQVVPTDDQGGG